MSKALALLFKTFLCLVLQLPATAVFANQSSNIDLSEVMQLLNSAEKNDKKLETPKTTTSCRLEAKVIKVVDGDTVHVLDKEKSIHKIRLAGIDAPERGQPYSKVATKFLKGRVAGKTVCIDWYKKDRYQRLVGVVLLGGKDINYQLVQNGLAWHFKKYQKEQKPADRILYSKAEIKSRLSVIGLWQEPDPIHPDDWRSGKRPEKKKIKPVTPQKMAQAKNLTFSCSGKRFCKHMTSCEEACYYLNTCGVSRIDRDKDGIPCESICGGC